MAEEGGESCLEKVRSLSLLAAHQAFVVITKIPICGGYLASTKSPENTCLKRFSNEETVPQPCLRRYMCRLYVFEHNTLLRAFGRIGFGWGDRNRKHIMLFAFSLSFIAWFMTISAACAYTNNNMSLRNTYWGYGDIDDGSATYYVGLKQVALDHTMTSSSMPWENGHVCSKPVSFDSKSYGLVTAPKGVVTNCGRCKHEAISIMRLVVSSTITQVFQITTDLQRTTRYGDLNCQKLFGCVTSFYGLFSALDPLMDFRVSCGLRSTLPPWAKTSPLNVTLASGGHRELDVEFKAGPGYILLFLALILKIVDAVCHLIVPTPEANHLAPGDKEGLLRIGVADTEKDHFNDLADYMMLSTEHSSKVGVGKRQDKVIQDQAGVVPSPTAPDISDLNEPLRGAGESFEA